MRREFKTKSGYLLQTEKDYLLSIYLDNTCMKYFNGNIGNTITM